MAERANPRGSGDNGVDVTERDSDVRIRLRVIAASDVPLRKLGQQIQSNVAGAIAEIAGMIVTSVDVSFEDVRSKA